MSDSSGDGIAAGRARGRARGRPSGSGSGSLGSEEMAGDDGSGSGGDANGGGGNGGGNGNGAGAIRGRGGYRAPQTAPLRTIPANVHSTAGEGGNLIRVMSNYFRLTTPQNTIVYQYHVDFEPNLESGKMRKGMIYHDHREKFGNAYIFDGMSNIKSTMLLPNEETELASIRKSDEATIRIRIRRTGEITWGHHEMIRLYNTQMRRNLQHLKYILVGRDYFDPNVRHKIPEHKLEIWQGLLTAVNEHDGGILMVSDTLHKVVRSDTVYELLQECLRRDRSNFQDAARRELSGSRVLTSYNNKMYQVDDIAFNKNPLEVFERKQGTISIKDYYKEQYNITIRDERQPLIVVRPSARDIRAGQDKTLYLVPELCAMTGLPESLKTNFDVKRQMQALTRADPMRRVGNLYNFIQKMNANPEVTAEMANWGIKFENNVIELPARVIPGEKIYMQNDTDATASSFAPRSGDFSKEIRGKPMKAPVRIPDWGILVTQRDRQIVDDFANTLNRVCGPLGVQLNRPNVVVLDNDRVGTFVDACKRVPPTLKIIVIIVPNNNKDRYDTIKKIFCCEQPMASQVIVSRTLSKKQMLMSVCTKIGIQMACKLGAEAWALNIPPKSLMVVGYDTHRDGTIKNTTVGGFVCSLNPTLTRWYSRVAFHTGREEMSNNFSANFAHGLKHYHTVNGKLPDRVVIYRDGVGEGDIQHVYDIELKQIKDAIKKVASSEAVRLAFVIVTKRLNARFFAKDGERQVSNPMPGTIIDTVVTRKERYDYYLISQSVRQGTVAPTMYNIIEDETNWRAHHHQQLSYKLTHLYYNWPGTIRVPAPCQYAHKLAYLTGTALHKEPSVRLSDTLFYL